MNRFLVFLLFIIIYLTSCTSKESDENLLMDPNLDEVIKLSFEIEELVAFPPEIKECSGMFYTGSELGIINDRGFGPHIYFYSPTAFKLNEIAEFSGAENIDWECISFKNNELVVGDLGNNKGARKDLKVIHLDMLSKTQIKAVPLNYPDQTNWDEGLFHNFDCEALIVRNGQYHLFTKNRANDKTNLYTADIDKPELILRDSLVVPSLVTDAYYDEKQDRIFLLCNQLELSGAFSSYVSIITINENYSMDTVAELSLNIETKLEAITAKNDSVYYLGAEAYLADSGKLYKMVVSGLN